jgi:single-strand DNA-binding protein
MFNKIMLIGHLGKDPEFNVTPDGTPVAKFTVATNRFSKNRSGERVKETDWFNIVAWRQLAETCEKYLHRGSKVYVEGRLAQRKYTDKNGVERTSLEVTLSEMVMLDSKETSGGPGGYAASGASAGGYQSQNSTSDDFDPFLDSDDLP